MARTQVDSRQSPTPRVIIVGAGFGGLAVANGLRKAPADVRLIDQRNHHLFQPMMYQVAMAQLRASDIAAPLRELFDPDASVTPHMDAVIGVDLEDRCVHFASGRSTPYDVLVLATGARYEYLGHPVWGQHALSMKSLQDAMALRERVFSVLELADRADSDSERGAYLTFVIVGAGPTGVELAGALGRLLPGIIKHRFPHLDTDQLRIVVADPADHALSSMPTELGQYADKRLRALGVELMTGTAVDEIESGKVHLKGGRTLYTATIIWAAGVEGHGAGDWLPEDKVDKHNRVPVKADMTVPGYPDVYVIGDAASARDADGDPYPGLATVAKQQGAYVANLIRARLDGCGKDAHERFNYKDYGSMAMISNGSAVGEIRGHNVMGLSAWFLWGAVHLYSLVGMHNKVLVLCSWFWSMLTERRQRVTLGGVSASEREASSASEGANPSEQK